MLPTRPRSSNGFFASGFPTETLYAFLFSSSRYATCPAHLIIPDLITPKVFGEQYNFKHLILQYVEINNIYLFYYSLQHLSQNFTDLIALGNNIQCAKMSSNNYFSNSSSSFSSFSTDATESTLFWKAISTPDCSSAYVNLPLLECCVVSETCSEWCSLLSS